MGITVGFVGTKLRLMRKSAAEIEEIYMALMKAVGTLQESIERLDLSWEGEANRSFMTQIESDVTQMYVLLSLIWDARILLEKAEGRYQEAERGVRYAAEGTN